MDTQPTGHHIQDPQECGHKHHKPNSSLHLPHKVCVQGPQLLTPKGHLYLSFETGFPQLLKSGCQRSKSQSHPQLSMPFASCNFWCYWCHRYHHQFGFYHMGARQGDTLPHGSQNWPLAQKSRHFPHLSQELWQGLFQILQFRDHSCGHHSPRYYLCLSWRT